MSGRDRKTNGGDAGQTASPYQVHLPGFITEQDIGLGDAIKRVTRAFGIKPCRGCQRRAAALNRWLVITRYPK